MKTIELFSGTKSFSKVGKKLGHKTFTIDNVEELNPDHNIDIFKIKKLPLANLIWASPPCTTFSVASIGTHWKGGKKAYVPRTKEAKLGLELLEHTIKLIKKSGAKYWFIENPRGVMRKVIDEIFKKNRIKNYKRVTVSYCQYGDKRMKPTDIWTNLIDWNPRPICKNGSPCHEAAPRGSKTGTQGLKGAKERGVIPEKLFYEIFNEIEIEEKFTI